MEISVKDRKLRSALQDPGACRKYYGADMAKKLELRVGALRAAESLADFWPPMSGPERCHELKGDLTGQFSIDLKQPYRLLFVPVEMQPTLPGVDERLRWQSIKSIELLEIMDTHG